MIKVCKWDFRYSNFDICIINKLLIFPKKKQIINLLIKIKVNEMFNIGISISAYYYVLSTSIELFLHGTLNWGLYSKNNQFFF